MGQVYSHLSEEERHDPLLSAQTHARRPPSMAREPQEIVDETDNRPMRVLGCRTPAEAFADELLESAENKDAALTNRQRA